MSRSTTPRRRYLTLVELSHSVGIRQRHLVALVEHGLVEPAGDNPSEWRFDEQATARLLRALRLRRDLRINTAGATLALDLLDELARLRAELDRLRRLVD
ncbi:MAG: hypothetical protein E2O54_06215 [Gammaproteobacteria bacterium]|nr:MAG: hypothetical protein E2O58_10320 [Gammaproteobacteria bacterium]TDJ41157.1 MAG: hypothetical protein E2O54_06215 [Gammaproteobacteria bacterium]